MALTMGTECFKSCISLLTEPNFQLSLEDSEIEKWGAYPHCNMLFLKNC